MQPFSTPWIHQKTIRFSDVFRGSGKDTLGTNGLRYSVTLMLNVHSTMHKKWSFPLWISSVNVTKFAGNLLKKLLKNLLNLLNKYLTKNFIVCAVQFGTFQLSIAFYIEMSHLNCCRSQMTGFYMKYNTKPK